MKRENIFNLIGIICGIAIIILGANIISTPADYSYTSSVASYTFGADYYTEQYAATEAVVDNTAVIADNITELSNKLTHYFGLIFIVSGVLTTLIYSKKLVCSFTPATENKEPISEIKIELPSETTLEQPQSDSETMS